MSEREGPYRIGQLADRVGVTAKAIRFYENEGILPRPQRTAAGYRLYSESDVERLLFVQRAKGVGLSLAEIADIIRIRDNGAIACVHVRQLLGRKAAEVNERLQALEVLKQELDALRAVAETTDLTVDSTCYCRILEHEVKT